MRTNCDTCAHDYVGELGGRCCKKIDSIFTIGEEDEHDELFVWAADNCDDTGAPKPGATGCPDHAPREGM